MAVSRREMRRAEAVHWPALRLPVRDAATTAVGAAVATGLLVGEASATAAGAALGGLVGALLGVVGQAVRRPAIGSRPTVRFDQVVPLVDLREAGIDLALDTAATARGVSKAPATPSYGIPVAPSIGGETPRVPRQRLNPH